MAEQKDMHSSPPVTAPKSQLAVEQPSSGGCWNPPKTDTHIQRQRRSHNIMVGGVQSQKNQSPYLLGGQPTNWRTIIPRNCLTVGKGSEPHIGLLSLGIWQRD